MLNRSDNGGAEAPSVVGESGGGVDGELGSLS